MEKMIAQLRFYLPSVVWAAIILLLSSMPPSQLPNLNLLWADKIGHLGMYLIFTGAMSWGYGKHTQTPLSLSAKVVIFFIGILFGIIMELLQYLFFKGRSYEYGDVVANTIGCFIGIGTIQPLFKL